MNLYPCIPLPLPKNAFLSLITEKKLLLSYASTNMCLPVEDHEVPEVCRGNDLSRSRCLMMNGAGLGHDVSAM